VAEELLVRLDAEECVEAGGKPPRNHRRSARARETSDSDKPPSSW
jgi:hypothetical protein